MALIITSENFESEVANSDLPVLVDFYADWCGPCKMMGPVVERIAEANPDKFKVGKCNVDNDRDLAMKYRIMSIPAFILFKNGEPAMTVVGAQSQQELEDQILQAL